jgi:uncharacterized protein (DUF362 family)
VSILSTSNPQNKTRVAIAKGSDPYMTTTQALKLVQDDFTVKPGDRIVIKPNIVRPDSPESGITTDVRVVEAVIEYLRDSGVEDIVIAEGGNPGTDKAFKKLGFKELEKRHGVGLVNLNKDEWEVVEIPSAVALGKVKVAKTVLECDGIFNVPKLKIHHMAQVTLALKNLMGVIVDNRGLVMHDMIDAKIVDLASLFKPVLNVVDGIVGAEKDEVVGDPVESNVIIAGVDMVSVDALGSAVMGLDPATIRHVQMAAGRGLGESELDCIHVVGEPIGAVMKKYSTEYSSRKLETYGLAHPLSEDDVVYMRNSFANRDPQVADPYR